MITIKVPATSANMGPGFDCLGVALDLYNYYEVEEISHGLQITGCEELYNNESNLIYTSMQRCFELLNYKPKGLRINVRSSIPISRGLGSSAACIVGGVAAANELAGGVLSKAQLLEIANEIEGHPDNIAPALLGGMTISIKDQGRVYYENIKISEGLSFCAIIPEFTLSTKEARAVLPDKLTYEAAVYNISRASMLVAALAKGSRELIAYACQDALHQPYRGSLIKGYDEIVNESKSLGCLGVFLSGAGPTIMAIIRNEDKSFTADMQSFVNTLENKWTVKALAVDDQGAVITRAD